MHAMIAQSIDCTQDFPMSGIQTVFSRKNIWLQSMLMQGRGHFVNGPG